MNLTKIKTVKNHTMYVNVDSLEYILKKEYESDAELILKKLQAINENLNIPKIYHIDKSDNSIYTYEQYIPGVSLQEQIDSGKFITEQQFKNYCISLIDTLQQLHANQIIHKDIKPSNIIINDEVPYLIDFNISRIYDQDKTKDTKLIGTEGYASPEQYGFTQTTTKTDIYSLGKTFESLKLITILEPNKFVFYKHLIDQMTMLDPEQRIDLINAKLTFLSDDMEEETNKHSAENTIRPNIRQIFKGVIITTHGRRWDVVASAFYLFYSHAFNYEVSEHVFDHYPLFLILITYYLTTVCFNFYTLNFSYPKLHNYKNRPRIVIAIQWYFVSFWDLFTFSFICYAIFETLYKLT